MAAEDQDIAVKRPEPMAAALPQQETPVLARIELLDAQTSATMEHLQTIADAIDPRLRGEVEGLDARGGDSPYPVGALGGIDRISDRVNAANRLADAIGDRLGRI